MISPYRIVLSFHVIAVVSWMAGILYFYRLLVYHAEEKEAVVKERFKMMESKLYRIITVPAMVVTIAMGVTMIFMNPHLMSFGWFHAKLTLVVLLVGATHFGKRTMRQLGENRCSLSGKQLRFLNEVPTLLMIGIVFLVILQPF